MKMMKIYFPLLLNEIVEVRDIKFGQLFVAHKPDYLFDDVQAVTVCC